MISTHDINQYLKKYNFEPSCYNAAIGVPKIDKNMSEPYFGTLKSFLKKYPNIDLSKYNNKIIIYMEGSKGFTKGKTYMRWVVLESNCIFIAPNSFKVKNRPIYSNKDNLYAYMNVHKFRQAELTYNLKIFKDKNIFNLGSTFLMGNSEGAVAAGIYKGFEFKARILLAWNCENGYYISHLKIGAKKNIPILNIIGLKDEYFGRHSDMNKEYDIEGNCSKKLELYSNAKIVLLPKVKHNLLNNTYVKDEIIAFINKWS